MADLPETPAERRQLLDEMSEIHDTLDVEGLDLFGELATQVAKDDDAANLARSEEIESTREVD